MKNHEEKGYISLIITGGFLSILFMIINIPLLSFLIICVSVCYPFFISALFFLYDTSRKIIQKIIEKRNNSENNTLYHIDDFLTMVVLISISINNYKKNINDDRIHIELDGILNVLQFITDLPEDIRNEIQEVHLLKSQYIPMLKESIDTFMSVPDSVSHEIRNSLEENTKDVIHHIYYITNSIVNNVYEKKNFGIKINAEVLEKLQNKDYFELKNDK